MKTLVKTEKANIKFQKYLWTPPVVTTAELRKKKSAKVMDTWCADIRDVNVQVIPLSKKSMVLLFRSGTFLKVTLNNDCTKISKI